MKTEHTKPHLTYITSQLWLLFLLLPRAIAILSEIGAFFYPADLIIYLVWFSLSSYFILTVILDNPHNLPQEQHATLLAGLLFEPEHGRSR
jgi:hypothetical protein